MKKITSNMLGDFAKLNKVSYEISESKDYPGKQEDLFNLFAVFYNKVFQENKKEVEEKFIKWLDQLYKNLDKKGRYIGWDSQNRWSLTIGSEYFQVFIDFYESKGLSFDYDNNIYFLNENGEEVSYKVGDKELLKYEGYFTNSEMYESYEVFYFLFNVRPPMAE